MYKLSKDLNLNFFEGKELINLSMGEFVVNLMFYENISINIECDSFIFDGEKLAIKDSYKMHVLLGKKIIKASHGEGSGDLNINFEGGHTLMLYDYNGDGYQSYNFSSPGGLVVV